MAWNSQNPLNTMIPGPHGCVVSTCNASGEYPSPYNNPYSSLKPVRDEPKEHRIQREIVDHARLTVLGTELGHRQIELAEAQAEMTRLYSYTIMFGPFADVIRAKRVEAELRYRDALDRCRVIREMTPQPYPSAHEREIAESKRIEHEARQRGEWS
jgi:hypothetical protein